MPEIKRWSDASSTEIAIWKIEEPEAFFNDKVSCTRKHQRPIKKLEHIAGRFLLQHLYPEFPIHHIQITPEGKPFIPTSDLYFSISHSYPYVAVALRKENEVGIDIQVKVQKILRLQDKFLNPEEKFLCENDIGKVTLAWTAKEAAFKWFGKGAVDFRGHIPITNMQWKGNEADMSIIFSRELPAKTMKLQGGVEEEFAWSFTL